VGRAGGGVVGYEVLLLLLLLLARLWLGEEVESTLERYIVSQYRPTIRTLTCDEPEEEDDDGVTLNEGFG